ncbi:MAG: hypothetical protein KA100_00855 [Rickettsiales bacterium]|nr:hypothetical protein [Rickettsiales bacterium]
MNFDIAPFVPVITNVSFLIGGAWLTYSFQKKFSKDDEKKRTLAFLISIRAEISSVWSRYYEEIGIHLESLKEHSGFGSYYPIFDRYFVVYDNNTNLLGNVTTDLSELIVKTYILAKGLKDSFLFNNDLLAKMTYYNDLAQETGSQHYKTQHLTYAQTWNEYGIGIQEMHFRLKNSQEILVNLINEQITKSKN